MTYGLGLLFHGARSKPYALRGTSRRLCIRSCWVYVCTSVYVFSLVCVCVCVCVCVRVGGWMGVRARVFCL